MPAAHMVLAAALLASLASCGKGALAIPVLPVRRGRKAILEPQDRWGHPVRGAAGPPSPSVRVVRNDCVSGNCSVEYKDSEVLVTAYCGPSRTAAQFLAEQRVDQRTAGRSLCAAIARLGGGTPERGSARA
jgi:hypothetical protein